MNPSVAITDARADPIDVSIVLVTYNSADWVRRCLDSIPAALGSLRAELIVVDNASADDTLDRLADYPDLTVAVNPVNVGFAAAVNQGAAQAQGRYVLLLNPDTEARPDSLANLVAFAGRHPDNGIYGGRTLRPDGTLEPSSCWNLPTLWSTACFATGLSTVFPASPIFDPEAIGGWARDSVREVGMITGCLLLTPTGIWRELGGLDERYFVYGEDADFAARARRAGYRPIVTPDAQIMHAIGESSDSATKMRLLLAGKTTYIRTHWRGLRRSLGLALLSAGVAVRAAGARLTGRGRKWSEAWDDRAQWQSGFVR